MGTSVPSTMSTADGVHHAMPGTARMHDLALAGQEGGPHDGPG
ncbi:MULTISPECIES: hypothetical protein [unclassified Streptomyces]|nr:MULTISPECIES: hypothetical protein [unclassified Streptomyces]